MSHLEYGEFRWGHKYERGAIEKISQKIFWYLRKFFPAIIPTSATTNLDPSLVQQLMVGD